MKNFRFKAVCQSFIVGVFLWAQQTPATTAVVPSLITIIMMLLLLSFTVNGTSTRSASGQPGQNTVKQS
jgi:hypothetical protein